MEHSLKQTLCAVALFLAAAPGIGQTEGEPYFALSSARTFGPADAVSVQMNAWNVDALDFRVYRIKDPVRFFEQLEDAHMFGGQAPKPPRELTLLERFHRFKSEWRHGMINLVRYQFSRDSRAQIREALSRHPARSGKVASFAEAPLLNSQQVVATWHQPVTSQERWDVQTVPVEVKGKGVYLVEAVNKSLRAYTIVIVSDLAMITKQAPGRAVAFIVNRKTGEPVTNAELLLWSNASAHAQSWHTNAQGLVDTPVTADRNSDLRLMARAGADFTVSTLAAWTVGQKPNQDWTGYIYTDRPVYRPGHTVNFRAIVRAESPSGYIIPAVRNVDVSIDDPDQKTVYRKTLALSRLGTIHDSFTLPSGSALGDYSIRIPREENADLQGSFEVQEYKKPEYEVRVTPAKPRIIEGETVQATIDARYYFGEPVKNAKVTWAVYKTTPWLKLLRAR